MKAEELRACGMEKLTNQAKRWTEMSFVNARVEAGLYAHSQVCASYNIC